MRITGGDLAGRRLTAPPGTATRPTSDRVREAIFNILSHGDSARPNRVLDLFAGAGSLGFEALSRGANRVTFVDSARQAVSCVRRNAEDLGLRDSTEVHCKSAVRFLQGAQDSFDWIFVDPPYASDLADQVLTVLGAGSCLAPGGTTIVERDRRQPTDPTYGRLVRTDCRRYGDTEVSFYRYGER